MKNNMRTFLLMSVMTVLFIWLGGEIGGQQGMLIALIAAAGMNFFGYWFSDKLVLKRYQARELGPDDDSRLYRIVSELAPKAGLPRPKVYVLPQPTPNAFATGRSPRHAAVAATEGIMDLLDDDELVGAPLIAMILRMMVSCVREYAADRGGAEISGKPLSLASALAKISHGAQRIPLQRGNPAHSHMFIVHPFFGGGFKRLFASHPPMEERIRRLEAMARETQAGA